MEDKSQPHEAEPKASKRPREEAKASQPSVAEPARPKQLAPISKARHIQRQVEALMPSPKWSVMPSRGTGIIRKLTPAEMDTSSETSENADMEAESEWLTWRRDMHVSEVDMEADGEWPPEVDMEAESEATASGSSKAMRPHVAT